MSQPFIKPNNTRFLPRSGRLYQLQTIDEQGIEPEQRFEILTGKLKPCGIDVANNRWPEAISALRHTISGVHGDFCSTLGSVNHTQFDPHQAYAGSLFISLFLQGSVKLTGRKVTENKDIFAGSLALALYERNRPIIYDSNNVKQLYLILPYTQARAAFGGGLDELILPLDAHPLAPFIRSQMLLLDAHAARLATKAIASILDGLHSMAILMLADIGKQRGNYTDKTKTFIYIAAQSYIEQHYARMDLTPDIIAKALHCSRSSLDRACLEQRTSVMKLLHEVRLNAVRHKLENSAEERIETIAYQCGFSNPSVLSKLYKLRFGLSPKAWREEYITPIPARANSERYALLHSRSGLIQHRGGS